MICETKNLVDMMATNSEQMCDISSMRITENSAENNKDQYDDVYNLERLYLNEMTIDRNDEVKTINELVEVSNANQDIIESSVPNRSMQIAFGILLRVVLPIANGVVRGFQGIRDVRLLNVLRRIASSRQALINLFAFTANTISMNLSSVQVSHRIEPILKLMKIRKSRDGLESLPDMPNTSSMPNTPDTPMYSPFISEPQWSNNKRKLGMPEQPAAKCCTLNVVAEPPPGHPIRADIIFIHGLHGSLVNTWKQGLWENERRPVEFARPPKPPVRPPKRPRHSRMNYIRPPHKHKRARFTHYCDVHKQPSGERYMSDDNDDGHHNGAFSYMCGQPEDIQICDGIEYSFPTFRLRMNDTSRLLQADIDSMLNSGENIEQTTDDNMNDGNNKNEIKNNKKAKTKTKPKPSPNDPNYSKCWPGDWLPLDCPGVRVIALNYTTDQYLWRPLWKPKEVRSNLRQRAQEMAELLIKHRVGYGHPIVWVGHSKGGLFIKQIIVDAWESGRQAMAPFWHSTRGVFFYSVPHRGSHLASIKAPLLTRSVELIDIEKNSKYLLDLHRRFVGLYHLGLLKIEVFSFVETALTLMSVLYLRIVGVDSADPGIGDVCGIRLDHREICKPRSRDCILYKELVKMIKKVC